MAGRIHWCCGDLSYNIRIAMVERWYHRSSGSLLLYSLSIFIGSIDLSVGDLIKLGKILGAMVTSSRSME